MPADTIARLTLAAYLLLLVVVVLWRALRCPQGWRLWVLHLIDSLYCRLCYHWRSNGPCPFLDEHGAIIIANHRSPLDPMLIWVGVHNRRSLECMTASEYFGIPGLQFIFEATRAIPVERDGKDLAATREALRRLKEGSLLGVFPEGRINTGPGMLPPNPGIAWLALHSRAPVYPVHIENAPQGHNMVAAFFNFCRVRVVYGRAVDLTAWYGRRITPELLQEVANLLMAHVAALGAADRTASPLPDGDLDAPGTVPLPRTAG